MNRKFFRRSTLALVVMAAASGVYADSFQRIASFSTHKNLPLAQQQEENSAEIIAATADGNMLIYTDSPQNGLGFIDISNAHRPRAAGFVSTDGEPTSVATAGEYALAAVNTSESFVSPSGKLVAVSLHSRDIVSTCDLGGQPDSIAVSPDRRFVAVAIENERDEDLNGGMLPQEPAGFLTILPLENDLPVCAKKRLVDLRGLAEIGGSDPEPEFVDFNSKNEIVVTLQENNHLVIVDAPTGKIINHFSAGTVDLTEIDAKKDGALSFTDSQTMAREPDTVKWLDDDRFVIANEGDYQGGARGFSIFHKDGSLLFESGASFEHEIIRAGHYPESRSHRRGNEPEGLAVGTIKGQRYIFVLSERASVIGVYKDTGAAPEFVQLLPSGIAPESALVLPERNLLISANEKDLIKDNGSRSHVMLYELTEGESVYPQIVSEGLIGWGAMSGLAADPKTPGVLYAVSDSFYSNQPTIFTIDARQKPARIINALPITRNGEVAEKLDLEGISVNGVKGFWVASEGDSNKGVPHALYHVNRKGEIDKTINFPNELLKNEIRFGAEGVTQIGNTLWVAIQRPWKDDPKDMVKLLAYNTVTGKWSAVHYPLEKTTKGWVGLSEVTAYNGDLYIIERDNQIGENAEIKRLYKVAGAELKPKSLGSKLPVVKKTLAHDFMPELMSLNGVTQDKIEGFTVDAEGIGYAITDNDGVDGSSGETLFFSIGKM